MQIWGMTDIGLVRKENQDAYLVQVDKDTGHTIAVVCDGMGGAKGGKLASELVTHTFMDACLANLRQDLTIQEVQRVADFAISEGNRVVYEKAQEDPELRGMGTTLVSAIVWGPNALVSNVGDSRGYLIHTKEGEGSITLITRDHSFVQHLVDRGDITMEEARTHPNRNLITRALGPEAMVEGDSFEIQLQPGDAVLLCTDGLIETVTDQEMEQAVIAAGDSSCMDRLLEIAKSRGASDNVTAVLLRQM